MRVLVYYGNDPEPVDDIFEEVKALYDFALGSMEMASGLLTVEDCIPLERIARCLGFKQDEEVLSQVKAFAVSEEQRIKEEEEERARKHQEWLEKEAKFKAPKGGDIY